MRGVRPVNMDGILGEGRSDEKSWEACQQRCGKVSKCGYFSFWGDGGCHLSPKGSRFNSDDGARTGSAPGMFSFRVLLDPFRHGDAQKDMCAFVRVPMHLCVCHMHKYVCAYVRVCVFLRI